MDFLPIIYLSYMFVSFYFLLATLLLYFKNKSVIFFAPKLTKHYSVSFIVPAFNEEKTITDTIKAISNIDYDNIKEIIIVNDGSKDNTLRVVNSLKNKYANLRVIDKKNSGKADSINYALKYVLGEVVIVVDADSYPDKESLKKMLGFFDNPEVGAVTATCIPRNSKTKFEKMQAIEYRAIALTRKLLEFIESIYVVPGTLAVYRKKALMQTKGFDTKNMTEDVEMTWHLSKLGWKVRMCLNAYVTTEVPNKIKAWYKQRRRWALGGLQTIDKYKKSMFSNGMLGYFIIPFFAIGMFLGLIGLIIFAYVFSSKMISSYLTAKYQIVADTPLVTMSSFYFTPGVLNYFGIILFALFFIFNIYLLSLMKDKLFEKQSFFNLFLYMFVYLLIYQITLITAIIHYIKGKNEWR